MILYLSLYLSTANFLSPILYFSFLLLCPKRMSPKWAMLRWALESPEIVLCVLYSDNAVQWKWLNKKVRPECPEFTSIWLCVLDDVGRWGECWYGSLVVYVRVYTQAVSTKTTYPESGVLVIKLSQLTQLSKAKLAKPRYLIMFCGISCESAGCAWTPAYRGFRVHDSWLRPNQTLISYT